MGDHFAASWNFEQEALVRRDASVGAGLSAIVRLATALVIIAMVVGALEQAAGGVRADGSAIAIYHPPGEGAAK